MHLWSDIMEIKNLKFKKNIDFYKKITGCILLSGIMTVNIVNMAKVNNIKDEISDTTYFSMDYDEMKLDKLYFVTKGDRMRVCTCKIDEGGKKCYYEANYPDQIFASGNEAEQVLKVVDVLAREMYEIKDESYIMAPHYASDYVESYNERMIEKEKEEKTLS